MPHFLVFCEGFSLRTLPSLQRTLSSELVELFQSDAVRGEDGGDDVASTRTEDVTMGPRNLLNEVMSAKHS